MDKMLLVKKLIKQYGTNNPFELCDYLDIIVIQTHLVGVRGFFQYTIRNKIIYVDNTLSEHEQTFVCAHELYHALKHKNINRIFMNYYTHQIGCRYETAADHFAVCMMYPDDYELLDYLDYSLDTIAQILGVSTALAKYRIETIACAKGF